MEKKAKKKVEETPKVVEKVHKSKMVERDRMIAKPKVTVLSTERGLAVSTSVSQSNYSIQRAVKDAREQYSNLDVELDLFSSSGEKLQLGDYFSRREGRVDKDLKRAKQWVRETRDLADLLHKFAQIVENELPKAAKRKG